MRKWTAVCGFLGCTLIPSAGSGQVAANVSGDPVTAESQVLAAQLQTVADDFLRTVEADGFKPILPHPAIVVRTTPMISVFRGQENAIWVSQWEAAGPQVQAGFSQFAAGAGATSGKQFFDQAFHRFFFTHEIAHWMESQSEAFTSPKVYVLNRYVHELDANRIAVAYWRQRDPAYLAEEIREFRALYAALPNPVPPGLNVARYFTEHYAELGSYPPAYGWFQMRLVLEAIDEKPQPTLTQLLRELPGLTYQ